MTTAEDHLRAQLDAAARQVAYCREHSPFYADLPASADAGAFADLDDFAAAVPCVTKAELIADQQAAPPFGRQLAVEPRALVRNYVYPAGQVLAWTAADQAMLEDMFAEGLACMGLGEDDVIDITFQFGWVAAGTIWDAGARRLGATVLPGGAGESARHAHNINLVRATSLIGFSTFLKRIADSAAEAGLDPAEDLAVRHLIIVGEWHGSDAKATLSARYGGARVREAYGTGETGLVATECEVGDGTMHVHPDVLVEVRHEATGQLVEDGAGGELYLTPLRVEGMPVLRFRTGDITEVFTREPCACGRITPRVGAIIGRVSDLLRVKGSFLSRPLLQSVLDRVVPGAGAFHVEVSRPEGMDRLVMRLELASADRAVADEVSRGIRERAGVLVEVEPCEFGSLAEGGAWFTDRRQEG